MTTFEQVADWPPTLLIGLDVEGSSVASNRERYRRARAILEEVEPWLHEYEEPPLLRLLVEHRGDMVRAADDPALIEEVRRYLKLDPVKVLVWQDLERSAPHPCGLLDPIGALLTEEVNGVRDRVGLRRLTMRQVAARRMIDVVRQVTADLAECGRS